MNISKIPQRYLNISAIIIFVSRIATSILGAISLILIFRYLDEQSQGYYYLVLAVVGIQLFFDFGMATAVSQEITSLRARFAGQGFVEIKSFIVCAMILYFVVGCILGASVYFYGNTLLSEKTQYSSQSWLGISILIFISYLLSGAISVVNGFQHVIEYSALVSCKTLTYAGSLCIFIALFNDVNLTILYALLSSIIVTTVLLLIFYGRKLLETHSIKLSGYQWKLSIFVFQGKLMLSWFSGYMLSHGLVIWVDYEFDIETAGKYGVVLQIITFSSSLLFSILSTAQTTIGNYFAAGDKDRAMKLFFNRVKVIFFILSWVIALGLIFYNFFDLTSVSWILDRLLMKIISFDHPSINVNGVKLLSCFIFSNSKRDPYALWGMVQVSLIYTILILRVNHESY